MTALKRPFDPSKHPRVPKGSGDPSGEFTKVVGSHAALMAKRARIERAVTSKRITGKVEQDESRVAEHMVAKLFGLKPKGRDELGHHYAIDLQVPKGMIDHREHHFEIKMIWKGTTRRISVKPDQMARKLQFAAEHNAQMHTITLEKSSLGWRMFYHAEYGNWRLYSRKTKALIQQQFSSRRELAAIIHGVKP